MRAAADCHGSKISNSKNSKGKQFEDMKSNGTKHMSENVSLKKRSKNHTDIFEDKKSYGKKFYEKLLGKKLKTKIKIHEKV